MEKFAALKLKNKTFIILPHLLINVQVDIISVCFFRCFLCLINFYTPDKCSYLSYWLFL